MRRSRWNRPTIALAAFCALASARTFAQAPGQFDPGDCAPPSPEPAPLAPIALRGQLQDPPIPQIEPWRFVMLIPDSTDLLLSDIPIGGAGDDETMKRLVDQFLAESDPRSLCDLAHRLHVQFTRRHATVWVIDPAQSARIDECYRTDPNPTRRAFALVALAKGSGATAAQYLEATDPLVRIAALRWLRPPQDVVESIAQNVVVRLLEDLSSAHSGVRATAATALGSWTFTQAAFDALANVAQHDLDPATRNAAAKALAQVRSLEARRIFTEMLRADSLPDSDRAAAIAALTATGIVPDPK